MKRSASRILTTHAGALPRPDDLLALNFMTSPAPATFGRDQNRYDTTQHEFLFADALRVEYRAITGAGFILQIDDPGMAENRCVARPAGRLDHLRS